MVDVRVWTQVSQIFQDLSPTLYLLYNTCSQSTWAECRRFRVQPMEILLCLRTLMAIPFQSQSHWTRRTISSTQCKSGAYLRLQPLYTIKYNKTHASEYCIASFAYWYEFIKCHNSLIWNLPNNNKDYFRKWSHLDLFRLFCKGKHLLTMILLCCCFGVLIYFAFTFINAYLLERCLKRENEKLFLKMHGHIFFSLISKEGMLAFVIKCSNATESLAKFLN